VIFNDLRNAVKHIKYVLFFFLLPFVSLAADKVTIGISPTVSSAGIFLAKENGHFAKFGIDPEIVIFKHSGADEIGLLSTNKLDVAGGTVTAGLFEAIAAGHGVKVVADKGSVRLGRSYLALLVRSDLVESGRYKEPKDLSGLSVGLPSLTGASLEIALKKIATKGGITLKDIQRKKLSYGEMNVAMRAKKLDAAIQLEPYLQDAVQSGFGKKVLDVYDIYPNQQSAVLMYSKKFTQKKDLAARFAAAYLLGIRDYLKAHQIGKIDMGTVRSLSKYIPVTQESAWQRMVPTGLNPDGFVNKEGLESDIVSFIEMGHLKKSVPIGQIVDNSFLEQARELLKE